MWHIRFMSQDEFVHFTTQQSSIDLKIGNDHDLCYWCSYYRMLKGKKVKEKEKESAPFYIVLLECYLTASWLISKSKAYHDVNGKYSYVLNSLSPIFRRATARHTIPKGLNNPHFLLIPYDAQGKHPNSFTVNIADFH